MGMLQLWRNIPSATWRWWYTKILFKINLDVYWSWKWLHTPYPSKLPISLSMIYIFKKNFMVPFYGKGWTVSRLQDPLRGNFLLQTVKSPRDHRSHLINLWRMKGRVNLRVTYTAQKWSFPSRISSVNVTKSTGNCVFGHIYWRNPWRKTSFFVQC